MKDRTVILTTLNDAWAEPNSVLDLFLHSFRIGNQTQWLLNHLVIICLDDKAYARCLASHPHCYDLRSRGDNFTNEAFFMTANYLKMMWTRIDLLASILQMGYNFVFTVRTQFLHLSTLLLLLLWCRNTEYPFGNNLFSWNWIFFTKSTINRGKS